MKRIKNELARLAISKDGSFKNQDENGNSFSYGAVGKDGHYSFCSEECLDPNSKKLVVEYGKNNSKTIEDDDLTSEQKKIKKFFQQIGKNSFSQQEVRAEVKGKDKGGDNN
ncbi:20286_t:CDS:2 [Funneliformis geosporum]|nr:20286_t:CDS:2 [Funneliformis geosporum]